MVNQEQTRVGVNSWRFSGKVEKKNFKYSAKGNAFASLMIRIPAKNEKFNTVMWVKAFKEAAEQINEGVEEQTNWEFKGYVSNSKYEKNGETRYSTDFIVTRFAPAAEQEKTDSPQEAVTVPDDSEDVPF